MDAAGNLGVDDAVAAFAHTAIGGGLSPLATQLIEQAGLLRDQPEQALALLREAQVAAPRHPAPLIAQYRFYFYSHRLEEARAVAENALAIARTALGPCFGDEPPSDEDARHHAAVRFYLFTLKGLAYLSLRLSDVEAARQWMGELRRLDPQDHVGGALLSHVLARRLSPDPAATEAADYPVKGWGPTP